MSTIETGHFLLTVVSNAEDVTLFTDVYNACTADEVLRGNAQIDERPLVILGTDKRIAMCKKKLPVKMKELDLVYNETTVNYITEATLKDFVTTALASLKEGVMPEIEHTQQLETVEPILAIAHPVIELGKKEEEPTTLSESETVMEQSEEAPATQEQTANNDSGLCRYGVPKYKVQHISPNVLGLRESLFVNLSDEDISNFFNAVKGKVVNSIKNDR